VRCVSEVMVRRVVGGRMSRRARMLGGGGVSEGVEGGRGTMGGCWGGRVSRGWEMGDWREDVWCRGEETGVRTGLRVILGGRWI